jgi:hypothetical protein
LRPSGEFHAGFLFTRHSFHFTSGRFFHKISAAAFTFSALTCTLGRLHYHCFFEYLRNHFVFRPTYTHTSISYRLDRTLFRFKMNRFLAFAALFAVAVAGQEDGYGDYGNSGNGNSGNGNSGNGYSGNSYSGNGYSGNGYNGNGYSSPTDIVSSFVAAPPMASTTQMANAAVSSASSPWAATTAVAGAVTSATSAVPSLSTISLVATPTTTGWPQSPMATHTVSEYCTIF